MSSSNRHSNNSHHARRLRPWQRRALQDGRRPLPEAPGDRPWLKSLHGSQTPSSSADSVTCSPFPSSTAPSEDSSNQIPANVAPLPLNYRFWPEDEMRRLIVLRNAGATWAAIYAAFPNRTPEAIKQAYHKRRHPVERQMEIEEAEAASSSDVADVEMERVG